MTQQLIAPRRSQGRRQLRLLLDAVEQAAGPLLTTQQDVDDRTVDPGPVLRPAVQQQLWDPYAAETPYGLHCRQLYFDGRLGHEQLGQKIEVFLCMIRTSTQDAQRRQAIRHGCVFIRRHSARGVKQLCSLPQCCLKLWRSRSSQLPKGHASLTEAIEQSRHRSVLPIGIALRRLGRHGMQHACHGLAIVQSDRQVHQRAD